ncbi:hypothetical protein [Haloferula sp. A504]|uniref:hypothetical protein n=1 Tax=Haloferula sp. A504 TaxID=3373601 RepID=UPI0031C52FE3|nr:hypothetical protein [Verrucomicrobiaceae bacterium E54]
MIGAVSCSVTLAHGTVIYSDAVEDNGTWTRIFGGFYPSTNPSPTAGSAYLAATTDNLNQRGFYDAALGTHQVAAGTYVVTFDIGIRSDFAFADRITPIIGLTGNLSSSANINGDDGARLLDTLDAGDVSLVSSTPTPTGEGFETWTLTYTVAPGASVIGQDLGFWAKFYTGDDPATQKGYAFDNFSVDFTAMTTYADWSGGADADTDTNGDGVRNAVAWALGAANVNENAIGLLPTLDNTSDPTYMIFTFERSDLAEADPSTAISVEYGNDLVGWTPAVDDGDDVIIAVTDASPKDTVVVKLKRSMIGASGRIFTRLKVVVSE